MASLCEDLLKGIAGAVPTCLETIAIARSPCTPPSILETVCEKNSACSYCPKEIAGLLKYDDDDAEIEKSRWPVSRARNWGQVGRGYAYVWLGISP